MTALGWTFQASDERTRQMLERACEPGTAEAEALEETHGMISLARAPHQELRAQYASETA